MEKKKHSKEFLEWKEKIEKGKVAILFVQTTEEYIGDLQMTLEMEFNISNHSEMFGDNEEEKEPQPEYQITLVGITDKLGGLIRLGVDKDLAMEFKEYQDKLVKERKKEVRNSSHD